MKFKLKNLFVNLLIGILAIVILGQVAFLFINSLTKKSGDDKLEVYATSDVYIFKKTGLINLFDDKIDFAVQKQIKIENEEDFASVFNAYFENLKLNGGYILQSNYVVSGTSKRLGMTAYQATSSHFEVSENGDVFSEMATVEVPNASGDVTGQGKTLAKKIWLTSESQKTRTTNVVTYAVENEKYKLNADYANCEVVDEQKNRECTLLPFVISENTIDQIEIVASNLVYQIEVTLNIDGFRQIAIDTMEQGDAIKMPEFKHFKVKTVIDKLGNVLSLGFSQNYDLTIKRIGLEITAETKSSSDFIIKRKESL